MKPILFETAVWANLADGWAIASRAYARAMAAAGVNVRLTQWMPMPPQVEGEVLDEVEHLIPDSIWIENYRKDRFSGQAGYVFSTVLGGAHQLAEPLRKLVELNRAPRIFYTMFERTSVAESIVKRLNQIEGTWVPCLANQKILQEAGCTKVDHIPPPYFDEDPFLALPNPRHFKTFYWIGRWEPRKAPDNLLRAFLRAFKPGESRLVLKLGPVPWQKPFSSPEQVLAEELEQKDVRANGWHTRFAQQDIEIIRDRLSGAEMLALHERCDVYCSASRGEGIDLPSFAAKLAGRRLITTDSGGPRDFLGEGDELVATQGSLPAKDYEWLWGPECHYVDYALEDLIKAMQRARASVSVPSRLPSSFHSEKVGTRLKTWLEERL